MQQKVIPDILYNYIQIKLPDDCKMNLKDIPQT